MKRIYASHCPVSVCSWRCSGFVGIQVIGQVTGCEKLRTTTPRYMDIWIIRRKHIQYICDRHIRAGVNKTIVKNSNMTVVRRVPPEKAWTLCSFIALMWRLVCEQQVYRAWINDYAVGCNYLSMPYICESGTHVFRIKRLEWGESIGHTGHFDVSFLWSADC